MTAKKKSAPAKPEERRKVTVSGIAPVGKTIFRPERVYRVKVSVRDALKKQNMLLSDDPAPRSS